jgi:hypothetical protein
VTARACSRCATPVAAAVLSAAWCPCCGAPCGTVPIVTSRRNPDGSETLTIGGAQATVGPLPAMRIHDGGAGLPPGVEPWVATMRDAPRPPCSCCAGRGCDVCVPVIRCQACGRNSIENVRGGDDACPCCGLVDELEPVDVYESAGGNPRDSSPDDMGPCPMGEPVASAVAGKA